MQTNTYTHTYKKRSKRVFAFLLTVTFVVTSLFVSPFAAQDKNAEVYAATAYTGGWEGNDAPTPLQPDQDPTGTEPLSGAANAQNWLPTSYAWPYPWSRNVEATGNWIADSYGISAADAALFEPVTVDRLADVLSVEDGRYYVIFATPRSKAGQKLVKAANAAAKTANAAAAGNVKKIYVFNPVIDDYQIDITLPDTTDGIEDWAGANSHTVKGLWTYVQSLLANGGAVNDPADGGDSAKATNVYDFTNYIAQDAVIFSSIQDTDGADGADLLNQKRTISAAAEVTSTDASSYSKSDAADTTLTASIGEDVFKDGTASYAADSKVRTDFDFARRFWNAGVNDYNGSANTEARIGRSDLNLFPTADEVDDLSAINARNVEVYTANSFPLEFVDFVEGYNLLNLSLNKGTWLNYFFATIGCHNSQAYIGEVADKALGYKQKVYVNDDTLDGSFRFGETVAAKDAKSSVTNNGSTANGWLAARATYKFSYLYGHTVEYFGPKYVTENESKKGNSVAYSYNGKTDDASALTKARIGFSGYDAAALAAAPAGNAVRNQIPFFIGFNGGTAKTETGYAPVNLEHSWIFKKTTDDGKFSDFMSELSAVWGTAKALASTNNSLGGNDQDIYKTSTPEYANGGGGVAFAKAGVKALDNVFLHKWHADPYELYVGAKRLAPTPNITGTAKVGQTVALSSAGWPQPNAANAVTNLTIAWKVNGQVVKSGPVNAANGVYTVAAADAGKKLTVSITGTSSVTNPHYIHSATTTATEKVVAAGTLTAATPTISGKAKVGKKLTVKAGAWTSGTKLTYQWYANGKAIKKATKATFKLTKAQKGKKITVKVTGQKAGYTTVSKTSKATAKVKK